MPPKKEEQAKPQPEVPAPNPEAGALANPIAMEEDAGVGFEGTTAEDFAVPFLVILQKGSPQVDEDKDEWIEGAKPGMLFNTVTHELYLEVDVVPCAYQRMMCLWAPRDSGGGFKGHYKLDDPAVLGAERDEKGRFLMAGTSDYFMDTRYHFVLVVKEHGLFEQAIIGMTSTQIKKSRQWMSRMDSLRLQNQAGAFYKPPMFGFIYHLSTETEENAQGTWKGWKVEPVRQLGTSPNDGVLYAAAREFAKKALADKVKMSTPEGGSPNGAEGDVPF